MMSGVPLERHGVPLVPEMVSFRATATPDAVALISGAGVLTYRELDSRASTLANALRSLEVGCEVVVGLCAPRSPAMVVGALAILKAGGAYLPLDPSYPSARLTFMLYDGHAPVVIVASGAENKLPDGDQKTILLDDLGRMIGRPEFPNVILKQPEVTPNNLAYVIYTSGSTGRPKGVEVTHRSLSNLVHWHERAFQVTSADRSSQIARIGFDAAVWEIWPYLAAGASLHFPDDETVTDPESLRDWLVTDKITISFVSTPMAERLLHLSWPLETKLRTMLTGADILHCYPPIGLPFRLVNNYGPTECTVVTTSGMLDPKDPVAPVPPIGRAIPNTEVYILDESGEQVANGTTGELHIGGIGLARGYRNLPELTAQKFIPNRFAATANSLLFKTGDLARFLPDGQIAFLGRMDEQAKIRGFRVEPSEVTAALNEHPHIEQSVVVAREESPGDTRLIGYFVAKAQSHLTLGELRDFLGHHLADFMMPAAFVRMEELPLTAHGKIDRKALPAPNGTNTLRDSSHIAPRTDLEKTVEEILKKLLKVEQIDVTDDFFSLGGHSLLGAQLVARLRDTFGIEMPLRLVFEAPTVAELACETERLLIVKVDSMNESEIEGLLDSTPEACAEAIRSGK